MEVEFRNKELSSYFNTNFLNVRVDMEGRHAEAFKNEFHIVFLPTLLFINPDGHVRMTIDHPVTARDLLKLGEHINGAKATRSAQPINAAPPIAVQSTPQQKNIQPAPMTKAEDVPTESGEGKILYVMGQGGDLPPEILRQEAYFRMELMDGSHRIAAKKYLDTQTDWTTEDNMQFIHDFLYDARSKEFEFVIANREACESLLGKSAVNNTINILVNKELERAFPRPDKKRIKELKSYL